MRSLLPLRVVTACFLLFHAFTVGSENKSDEQPSPCPNGPMRDLPDMRGATAEEMMMMYQQKKTAGGLIFFLHIPKTGGTSIRRNFERLDHVEYIFGRNYSVYWDEAPKVEDLILGNSLLQQNQNRKHRNRLRANTEDDTADQQQKEVIFFEVHASTAPSFYRLRERLARWRQVGRRNNVPVFFFTVVRDPIAFAVSHFNYFHVDVRNPTFEHVNATEDNFLRLSLHNPQCQFLFKGEASMRNQLKNKKPKEATASFNENNDVNSLNISAIITPEECDRVQHQMTQLFDWIGTTETLSNETLPLLAQILGVPSKFNFGKHRVSEQVKKVPVDLWGMENMSKSGFESIRERSQLDLNMYSHVRKHYPYCMWNTEEKLNPEDENEEL